jgi:hypothetical protein
MAMTAEEKPAMADPNANARNEMRLTDIVEFSCSYGYISHGRDSLRKVYKEKERKDAKLANGLRRVTGKQV